MAATGRQGANSPELIPQVILEKFETIRLYSWDQINTSDFIPTTFSAPFNPTPNATGGFNYTGTVSFASAPVSESYSNDLPGA